MSGMVEHKKIEKVKVENEIAFRRAQQLIEFIRGVCAREAQIFNSPEESTRSVPARSAHGRRTV